MKFCPECGKPCEGAKFCPECGFDLRPYISTVDSTQPQVAVGSAGSVQPAQLQMVVVGQAQTIPANIEEFLAPFKWKKNADGKTYTIIGVKDKKIQTADIPNSVTSIGDLAFSNCSSLTSINIPNSVTSIGYDAFSNCSSLASITIPNSVTSIRNSAFHHCRSLTSINIPNSVTSIGSSAFSSCSSLTSINIPNSVTSIGEYTFYNCSSLKEARIPSHTQVAENTFPSTCEIIRY